MKGSSVLTVTGVRIVTGVLTVAGVLIVTGALLAGLASAFAAPTHALTPTDDPACNRSKFETELVAAACKEGGQKAAKKAMQAWVKGAKDAATAKGIKLNCATCHSKVKDEFPLKDDGLKHFKDLGGK